MDWKKVKSILLAVLIGTNLFLVGNLFWQVAQGRAQQRQAMADALELLHRDVGDFDDEMFRQMGTQQEVVSLRRAPKKERAAAQALLGKTENSVEGDVVSQFTSPRGQLIFRAGGVLELEMTGTVTGERETFFLQMLEEAGFPMEGSRAEMQADQVVFTQYTPGGLPIQNSQLTCRQEQGNRLVVTGVWLLDLTATKAGEGERGYQMVMALRARLREQKITAPPEQVELVYYVDPKEDLMIVPVWRVTIGEKVLGLNGLDGNLMEDIF